MLVQNHVKSNKKGAANILAVILLILLAMSSIFILWRVVNKIVLLSPEDNCLNYIDISIEEACYLNENEIKVKLKRGLNNKEIKKLRFSFSPSNSLWEITGEKCLDVKLEKNSKYGSYCSIPKPLESSSYIFNFEPDQNKVAVSAGEASCLIGEKEIKEKC